MERWLTQGARPGRTALALLLILLLGGSAVELHRGEEAHGEAAANLATHFVASASHPGEAQHVEAASEASRRHSCAVCLHNLLTSGLHLQVNPGLLPGLSAERVALPRTVHPADLSRLPNGARAPPAA